MRRMNEQGVMYQAVINANNLAPEDRRKFIRSLIKVLVKKPTEWTNISPEAHDILQMIVDNISYVQSQREAAVLLAYLLELSEDIDSMPEDRRKAMVSERV